MDVHSYKGHHIRAVPFQLKDTGEWKLKIEIQSDVGGSIRWRPFSAEISFPTREEAVNQCFGYGRKIIDGEIEGYTV